MKCLLAGILGFVSVCLPAAALELVPWEGSLPSDAILAGHEGGGSELAVCVVSDWGGQHPGALTEDGTCRVAWGGQEHLVSHGLLVLVGGSADDGEWVAAEEGSVPGNAFRAGGDDGGPLYVCRAPVDNGLVPGKLTDHGWCYVAHDGEEHYFVTDYEVLVE